MTKWKKVPESRFDEMLCILPPICHRHDRFMVGEAYDHMGEGGHARYTAFVRVNGQ
jgi:hypothetical protein